MNARRFIAVSLALLVAGPAAAAGIGDLPSDVLAAVEVDAPAERLDTVAGTTAWEGLGDLLASLGRHESRGSMPVRLASFPAAWPEDAVPRDRLRALAGKRLMVAAIPVPGSQPLGWAVAMDGEGGDASAEALEGLAPSLGLEARPVAHGWVALIDDSGLPWALGRQAGSWTVVGPPGPAPAVERLRTDAGGLLRTGDGVLRAVGDAAPRTEHAAQALRVAAAVERVADGLGDLRTQARVEHDGDDTWLLGHAELELR